jgi:hypothetical protein
MSRLEAIGGDVGRALERVNVPAYVIGASGVIRWLNAAALGIVGDVRGRQFTSVVAPEDRRLSCELFAQKVTGAVPVTDADLMLLDVEGERVAVEVSSVPLMRGERIIGVFGQLVHHPVEPTGRTRRSRSASPRYYACSSTAARRSRSPRSFI